MVSSQPQPSPSQATHHPRIPVQPTPFIGRDQELADIADRLVDPACRMLTLIGVGGIGKTRLSIQIATDCEGDFGDGVHFIPLQSVQSTEFLPAAMADTLQMTLAGQSSPFQQVCAYLRDRNVLLVLDNFEHLLMGDGPGLLSEFLIEAPQIKLLITSREALHLREEWLYTVNGLPFPVAESPTPPTEFAAVELFVERARQVRHDFAAAEDSAALNRICQLVEGMPLALELAATWTRSLTCTEIAAEIQGGLDFLSTGLRNMPARHRSMQAIFDHTWQQLSATEQAVFARVSVFRGGFSRKAATEVAGASLPLLSSLQDKALLRWEPATMTAGGVSGRYQVHELLRQYGAEQLAQSPIEEVAANDAHCAHFCDFLHTRRTDVNSGRQREAFQDIRAELENIRAAWQWAIKRGRVTDIQKANYSFFLFFNAQGRYVEGIDAFEKAIQLLDGTTTDVQAEATLAALQCALAWLTMRLGRLEQAQTLLEHSRSLFQRLPIDPQPGMGTDPLTALATLANIVGNYGEATRHGEAARRINEARGDKINLTLDLYALTSAAYAQGQYEAARVYAQQAYDLAEESQNHWFTAYILNTMGIVARAQADYARARQHFQECYAIRETFADPEGMALALSQLGKVAILEEDSAEAAQLFEQSLSLYQEINDHGGQAIARHGLGQAALLLDHHTAAQDQLRQAFQIAAEIQIVPLMLSLLIGTGDLLLQSGQTTHGLELLTFAARHPAGEDETKAQAQQRLAHWESLLPPDLVAAAKQASSTLDLSAVTAHLLRVLSEPVQPITETGPRFISKADQPLIEPLSERELEVLHSIAAGFQNREIATELTVTLSTVKTHINNIYRKLNVTNRVQAVSRATELGLL